MRIARLGLVLGLMMILADHRANAQAIPPVKLEDWTPRPATGKVEPWEKMTDKDWVDGRFRLMNTGPALHATYRYQVGQQPMFVYKGLALKLGSQGDAGIIFDRSTLKLMAVWTGGWLQHSDRRFGLLNTPSPIGALLLANTAGPGWADPQQNWATTTDTTAPLPSQWAKYRGMYRTPNGITLFYLVGTTQVLEHYYHQSHQGKIRIDRQIVMQGSAASHTLAANPGKSATVLKIPDGKPIVQVQTFGDTSLPKPDLDWKNLIAPAPKQWGEPIVTKLVRGGETGPLAVDTLTIPYKNQFNALFFCTGVDVLPDGRIAVCTCHGDVWLVSVDEAKQECRWQRYATGLYHPLGLKVVDGKVFVLERGQLTRLHDLNNDGEADFYECFNNDWHTGNGEHSYDTCLETDPEGHFYFFKTGDTHLPSGGCLMKVSRDGKTCTVYATGFRHPIGMGMSENGIITGADQEGNWMPATRIDQYKPGGFYGDLRAHHRSIAPTTYDPPMLWLPRQADNSAGGQVWVPQSTFGPLAGLPLHLSYGRCKTYLLLRQEVGDLVQAGAWDLGIRFLSGSCRARFHNGMMYVCGLNGWQTAAQADGSLQRVRSTGKPFALPVKMEIVTDGVKLTFNQTLDRNTAESPENFKAAWWNYRWSGDYGSKRWKVSNPNVEGQDDVLIEGVKLLEDKKTLHVRIPSMQPVMQLQLGMNILTESQQPITGSMYMTVHRMQPTR